MSNREGQIEGSRQTVVAVKDGMGVVHIPQGIAPSQNQKFPQRQEHYALHVMRHT